MEVSVKKSAGRQAIETHDISQRKYPMPGTDLGETNAIPYAGAYDVDMSGGRQSEYCLGRGDRCSNMSRLVEGCEDDLKPAANPTRLPRMKEPWELNTAAAPMPSRRRK